MARSRKLLTTGALGVAAVALLAATTSTTGAYFTETVNGGITGNIGAVNLSAPNTMFTWTDMMPGEQKTAKVDFTNKGTGPQDFYLVFPNATALSALNSLGEYGEVHFSVNGIELFASKNLNDGYTCGTPGLAGVATLCAVPKQFHLVSQVAPNVENSFEFKFSYSGKLKDPLAMHGVFNKYPALKTNGAIDQNTVISTDGTGAGLPFKIVATQVGQTP